jgi:hypothetical protein
MKSNIRFFGYFLGLSAFLFANYASAAVVTENVIWGSPVNVSVSANNITKNAGCNGCSDSGALSNQSISSAGGFVEFQVSTTALYMQVGIGNRSTAVNDIRDAENGIRFNNGYGEVYNNTGTWVCGTAFIASDVFKITVASGVVRYFRNNNQFCQTALWAAYPLAFDATMGTLNQGVRNAKISYDNGTASATTAVGVAGPSGLREDKATISVTNIPAPAKGVKITDPKFPGTVVMRLTDGAALPDGIVPSECHHIYSFNPVFNSDYTKIMVTCAGHRLIIPFNPSTHTIAGPAYYALPIDPATGKRFRAFGDNFLWSSKDPNIFYFYKGYIAGENGRILYWRNLNPPPKADGTKGDEFGVEMDFSAHLRSNEYIWQLSKSEDDDIFTFTRAFGDCLYAGYTVWQRSTRRVLLNDGDRYPIFDESNVDKTGNYVLLFTIRSYCNGGSSVPGGKYQEIHNIKDRRSNPSAAVPMVPIYNNETQRAPGHYAMGRGNLVGETGFSYPENNGRRLDSQANTQTSREFMRYDIWSGGHYSLNADNEGWYLASNYPNNGLTASYPLMNEIFQVSTDGNRKVRRIFHHHSLNNDGYWDMPRANISRNGRYVTWTSNWHGARRDVYLAIIPASPDSPSTFAYIPPSTTSPTPSPTTSPSPSPSPSTSPSPSPSPTSSTAPTIPAAPSGGNIWEPGKVLHFELNESAGSLSFTDVSGSANHGTCLSAVCPSLGVSGKIGTAAQFNGDDYIQVPGSTSLKPATVAISAYIRTSGVNVGSDRGEIASLGDDYSLMVQADGRLKFFYYAGGSTWVVAITDVSVFDNQLHHVVGQKTATGVEIWVDGVRRGVGSGTAPIYYRAGGNLIIGRHGLDSNRFFRGTIDEVKIYNRTLSNMEITSNLLKGSQVLSMNLNEAAGATTFRDASGYNHNGSCAGTGCPVSTLAGKVSSAVSLDGGDFIQVTGTGLLKPTAQVAVAAFVKATGLASGSDRGEVLSLGDDYSLSIQSDGNAKFFFYAGNSTWVAVVSSGVNLRDGNYHHVVGQKTTAGVEIYIDGVLNQTVTSSLSISYRTDSNYLIIGRHGRDAARYFIGSIDEVGVYNRALTLAEIRALAGL